MTDKAEMSFWDHLEDLRWVLVRVISAMAVCMIASFVFVPDIFDRVVMAPSRSDFFFYRFWSGFPRWLRWFLTHWTSRSTLE